MRSVSASQCSAAYLELHIEQGPVLESMGLPLAAVLGTKGVERHTITFHGQEAHSGSTPMHSRRDALAAAAKLAPRNPHHRNAKHPDAVCTIGSVKTFPRDRHRCRRPLRSHSRSTRPGCPGARHHVSRSSAEEHSIRARKRAAPSSGRASGTLRPSPFHPALIELVRRMRYVRPLGRTIASHAQRPVARRSGSLPLRNSHRHALCTIAQGNQPQQRLKTRAKTICTWPSPHSTSWHRRPSIGFAPHKRRVAT
jgi:acetylornithine deacetylase/succinyl-diaminopimelate desuccinylase-like protein